MRAFDVRTGKLLWTFNTIPRPGEFGNDTWENESWAVNGNTGVWTQITVDEELGLVYLPVETPTSDFYGGHRPGNNLFAESIVCVDLKTGQRKWHFQLVHHPLWNYDMSSAAILADITVNGEADQGRCGPGQAGISVRVRSRHRPAGLADRGTTGAAVRRARREGEPDAAVPDQAACLRAQLAQGARRPDRLHAGAACAGARADRALQGRAVDVQPGDARQTSTACSARSTWETRSAAPTGRASPTTPRRTPSTRRRTTSASPRRRWSRRRQGFSDIRYVSGVAGRDVPRSVRARRLLRRRLSARGRAVRSAARRGRKSAAAPAAPVGGGGGGGGLTVDGLSILKPPYGTISRVNLDRGEIVWQVPHGDTPDNVRNHPAAQRADDSEDRSSRSIGHRADGDQDAGGDGRSAGDDDAGTSARRDAAGLRQGDGERGRAVWMPAPQSGSPMTYLANGSQYIVVAISGGNYSGEYIAFALGR